jgi:hypothetical protein
VGLTVPHVGCAQHTASDKSSDSKACCCQSAAAANGQNGTRRVVLAEPLGALDGEQLREPAAGTIDPALDRPYRVRADRSRLVVGDVRRFDEEQGLALAEGGDGPMTGHVGLFDPNHRLRDVRLSHEPKS